LRSYFLICCLGSQQTLKNITVGIQYPVFRIRCFFTPGSRIRDGKKSESGIRDEHP
jgi:hypothetical protein